MVEAGLGGLVKGCAREGRGGGLGADRFIDSQCRTKDVSDNRKKKKISRLLFVSLIFIAIWHFSLDSVFHFLSPTSYILLVVPQLPTADTGGIGTTSDGFTRAATRVATTPSMVATRVRRATWHPKTTSRITTFKGESSMFTSHRRSILLVLRLECAWVQFLSHW